MKLLSVIMLCLASGFLWGQGYQYPKIKGEGKTMNDFVPKGWKVLKSATGDLNNDSRTDAAFVIQHIDSVKFTREEDGYVDTIRTQPRILVIAFRDNGDKLKLIEQNNSFVLNHERVQQDDPFVGISINKGILRLDFELFYTMGSWYVTTTNYKFRYQDDAFTLIGADYESYHRASGEFEKASYNFLTGRWSLTRGIRNKPQKPKTKWHTLSPMPLKTFKTFKEPFTWKVTQEDIRI